MSGGKGGGERSRMSDEVRNESLSVMEKHGGNCLSFKHSFGKVVFIYNSKLADFRKFHLAHRSN